jgi:signal peptidase II
MAALWIAIGITLSDQWTKQIVRDTFRLGESHPVLAGFLNWTYLRNTGAAWGMMRGQNAWLVGFSLSMLLTLVFFRRSFLNNSRSHRLALGCMIGGIMGNLLDRIRAGYVTDFIDLFLGERHWPAFNLADSAICIGVGVYLLSSFMAERKLRRSGVSDASTLPAS